MAGTGAAVPSDAIIDLKENSQVFDRVVNSDSETVVGRVTDQYPSGKELLTIIGMNAAATTGNPAVGAAQAALDYKNEAQTYAEAAATNADWVYSSVADGEAARVDGDYFWVVSADNSEVLELWLMGVSTATDTGKRTIDKSLSDERWSENRRDFEYSIFKTTNIFYDSLDLNLEALFPSVNTGYGSPFTGFGGEYSTPATISFNAVRIRFLSRKSDVLPDNFWWTLGIQVRTAPSIPSSGTLIAVGEVFVNPNDDVLENVIIKLKDPSTGADKILTESDLSGQYFIGTYARNAEGGAAYVSPHAANQSNDLEVTRYTTSTGELEDATWKGDIARRVGVDHLLLTNATEDVQPELNRSTYYKSEFNKTGWYGEWNVKNFISKLAKSEDITMAFIGDSWTNARIRYYQQMTEYFSGNVGSNLGGYVGVGDNGAAGSEAFPPLGASSGYTGGWSNGAVRGVDGYFCKTSASSGDTMYFSGTSTAKKLHYYQQSGGGTFEYTIDGGTAVSVNTDGADELVVLEISGAGILDITVTSQSSAGVSIFGCDVRNDDAGVLIHKLGNSGATASRLLEINSADFDVGFSSLAPDVATILLGANDHAQNVNPLDFYNQIEQIADRVLSVNPLCDIVLIGTGPSNLDRDYQILDYSRQMSALARNRGWSFVNLSFFLGSYDDANDRGLYSDDVHVNSSGGEVNRRAITEILKIK